MTKTRTDHFQALLEINSIALDLLKSKRTKMTKTCTDYSQVLLEINSVQGAAPRLKGFYFIKPFNLTAAPCTF